MKVYRLKPGKPTGNKSTRFASLDCKRSAQKLLSQCGKGIPFKEWREIELSVYNPRDPRPDFFNFGLNWVCNQRAREIVGPVLERSGELLPLTVQGEKGPYYLYNCTTVVDALDPDHSMWEFFEGEKSKIAMPAFHSDRLGGVTLFHYPRSGLVRVLLAEHTGDDADHGFKALVQDHGLTGLSFELLWSEEDGPARPAVVYRKTDPFQYCTIDGKPWVFAKPKSKKKTPTPARKQRSQ